MLSPADFLVATKWAGLATLAFAALTGVAFLFSWGVRFRFVGVTGFTLVLTVGLLGLSVVPITRQVIPGAVRYTTVYDSGAAQMVITVPPDISASALRATLQQAAANLFTSGRLGSATQPPTVRARILTHPAPGISQLVYLGQVEQSPREAESRWQVTLYPEGLATLAALQEATSIAN